ncbi:MAG: hypothetical protein R3C49_01330 [Planctomycetaceae bacterium]
MATDTLTGEPKNPFRNLKTYSPEVVELMRALSAQRKESGQPTSTPVQVLEVIRNMGYLQPEGRELSRVDEVRRFGMAMSAFQKEFSRPYPTCEDLLTVLSGLGYHREADQSLTVHDGVAIDRRRREEDERRERIERRASLELSAQEQLDLTDEEHQFLDALKELRVTRGRDFASSEEILSILWDLGYRPMSESGLPALWLDHDQRCRTQMAFTNAVERTLSAAPDTEFLTCRTVLEIIGEIGFQQIN